MMYSNDEYPEFPGYLKRASDQVPKPTEQKVMKEVQKTFAASEVAGGVEEKAKRKTVKANGTTHPKGVKGAKAKAPKPEKVAKPVKEKPAKAKAVKARTVNPAGLDQYGLRLGSLKSQAAALYASKRGATLTEVKDKVGSIQYNVLTQLEAAGFTIERKEEEGKGQRPATRYKLIPK